FLGDGDAVLGDARRAEALVEHDVAALRAERDLHRIGEGVDAAQHLVARLDGEFDFLGSHFSSLQSFVADADQAAFLADTLLSRTPTMSASFMMSSSSPSIFTSVPAHLPNSTRSPASTSSGVSLPASSRPPGPTARTSPSDGFSLAVSGMMMPPAVFSSDVTRRTTTRSCSGRNRMRTPPKP